MIVIKCPEINATISLDIADPNEHGAIEVEGNDDLWDDLNGKAGFRHSFSSDSCNGFDLIAVLLSEKIAHEVIQGADILAMPEEELPEGAID